MKTIQINYPDGSENHLPIPKGHEIDQEKSNLSEGKIVFKEVKKALPKTWEELGQIKGYWVADTSQICSANCLAANTSKMVFATRELAEASIAMAQLSQLREVYRDGWKPNWSDDYDVKYVLTFEHDSLKKDRHVYTEKFLSFQSVEIRDEFLNNFASLIETAKPLMS